MTDNEIIKALECCAKPHCNNNNCPMYENTINTKDCITKLSTNALDLINQQRAEIERLTDCNDDLTLKVSDIAHINVAEYEKIRAEAAKEFAEKIKSNQRYLFNYIYSRDGFCESIDNLVKEMIGEQR